MSFLHLLLFFFFNIIDLIFLGPHGRDKKRMLLSRASRNASQNQTKGSGFGNTLPLAECGDAMEVAATLLGPKQLGLECVWLLATVFITRFLFTPFKAFVMMFGVPGPGVPQTTLRVTDVSSFTFTH